MFYGTGLGWLRNHESGLKSDFPEGLWEYGNDNRRAALRGSITSCVEGLQAERQDNPLRGRPTRYAAG